MNKLIIFPLLIMTLFMISGINQAISSTNSFTVNNTETTTTYTLDYTVGFTALIITLVTVGAIAGVKVLGSGLSNISVELIIKSSIYLGLWGILSAFGFTPITSIPYIGGIVYLCLTLMYLIGFVFMIGKGDSDD